MTTKTLEHLQVAIRVKKDWTMSWWEQFLILIERTYRARYKDYFDVLRLAQALGVAVLLGLLWWKSSTYTESQLRDQVITLYYSIYIRRLIPLHNFLIIGLHAINCRFV